MVSRKSHDSHDGVQRSRPLPILLGALAVALSAQPARADDAAEADAEAQYRRDIVVTASTVNMLGVATTSSEGSITRQELQRRPAYRTGQYLETVPGLAVTSHSGEGKANQYLLRGFNLDHGTDFATFVDGMPVNQRTHAHGQGYSDLNFLIPELFAGLDFTKGAYFASEGDFATVGSARIRLVDSLPATASAAIGDNGDRRLFLGGSTVIGSRDTLVAAGELFRLDGPWENPDRLRRLNAVVRWVRGAANDGVALTAMGYDGRWNATTDQPVRAVEAGLIGRFGSLDPTDGGRSSRYSLSLRLARSGEDGGFMGNAYVIRQQLTLWSNFTHFLVNPELGDQQAQNDRRWTVGGDVTWHNDLTLGSTKHRLTLGATTRIDCIDVDLQSTVARTSLALLRDNRVDEQSAAAYLEHKGEWTPWLRSVLGLRGDVFRVRDRDLLRGEVAVETATLLQPKASVVIGPWASTEIYLSAGRGFHSNDGRAGETTDENGLTEFVRPPLLVKSASYEIGMRTNIIPHLHLAITGFRTDFDSELVYSADAGQTEAGRPSRRTGIEITGQYRPLPWLEINSNLAFSRARYRDGVPGNRFVEDAPRFVGAAGILVDNLGPWSGSLVWRRLGPHPLTDDNSRRSSGYSEFNLGVGYRATRTISARIDIFNLFDSKDNAADYFYASRLPGEPEEGVEGLNAHPLEPRSVRFTLSVAI